MALDMVEYLIDKIIEYQWQTKCLQLTTNGLIQETRIVDLLSRFCKIKKGNFACLRVSTDEFHDVVSSAKALSFYWGLCQNIPEIAVIPADTLPVIHMRGRAKLLMQTHPKLTEKYYVNEENSNLNHRVKIIDNKVICGICVHANGNVGLTEQISYDDADTASFGNIITASLAEMVDKHNNRCLITCDELQGYNLGNAKWSWKYIDRVFEPCEIIPHRIKSRYVMLIFDAMLALRKKARDIYPDVPAQDIIDELTFDTVREWLEAKTIAPLMSAHEAEKHLDNKSIAEINEFFWSSTQENKEFVRIGLILTSYHTQELRKSISFYLNHAEQLPQFQKLKELNAQYQSGYRHWNNGKNYLCDDDKNPEADTIA